MKLKKENQVNLTDQAVEILREMILSSGLKPGERFGNESELAEKLKISRPILREAVNRLRALKLLESRQGVGLTVGKPNPMALFEEAFGLGYFNNIEIKELAELRYTLEVGVVDQVVQRITPDQILRLEQLAGEIAECKDSGCDNSRIDELELEFHKTYLESSHNSMLIRMHNVIVSFFNRASNEIQDWDEEWNHEDVVWGHRAIVKSLIERNAERLRAVLTGHLSSLIN